MSRYKTTVSASRKRISRTSSAAIIAAATFPELSGTGVGLYLVRMVVDLHGGTVAVESKEGEGSRFTVRLPIWRPSQTEILSLSTEFVQDTLLLPTEAKSQNSLLVIAT